MFEAYSIKLSLLTLCSLSSWFWRLNPILKQMTKRSSLLLSSHFQDSKVCGEIKIVVIKTCKCFYFLDLSHCVANCEFFLYL